jgi:nitroimidazol reductase NimA-like FMN-containing flavoprotein (pyridoxamine 5'-phosphate oxidase superfamily)
MDQDMKRKIVSLLDGHRTMRIATIRPDGWPQTTTVGYANDGLTIYFLCGKESQKAANLAKDDRVSIAIDDDSAQVMQIKGLSMAARAHRVTDGNEGAKALGLLFARYPAQEGVTFAPPSPVDVAIFRVTPTVVSVLDYALGFAHTDVVECDTQADVLRLMKAVGKAAVAYFATVYTLGFALGTIRVLAVAPRLGELPAVILEAPIMLAASWVACGWALKAFGVRGRSAGLLVGGIAFMLLMSAEAALSFMIFGRSLDGFLRAFATAPGSVGLAGQLASATFPTLRSRPPFHHQSQRNGSRKERANARDR